MAMFEPYDPEVANPYPDTWQRVGDFSYDCHLYLARAREAVRMGGDREAEYVVAAEYRCSLTVDGRPWTITVPSGMLTDLTSSPWLARLIVGRVGPHLEAAIVHDFLFLAWQDLDGHGAREQDFRFANAVMMAALRAADVGWLSRTAISLAISSFVGRSIFDAPNPRPRYVRVPPPPGGVGPSPVA